MTDDAHDPAVEDPHADGVPRRRLLQSSAVVGAATATAGCSSLGGSESPGGEPTVYVFNTGDKTISIVDAATDELVTTQYLGATSSFPSNQYAPELVEPERNVLWLNVRTGVRAVDPASLTEEASVETGSPANWQELTPDGERLIVSARQNHRQYEVDADPASESFGSVVNELDRAGEFDNENGGPGPCDVTIEPDGNYAFVPDIYSDTLTVLDLADLSVATQVSVDPVVDGVSAVKPWMGTVSLDGRYLTVENNEGEHGTESIWDVSDPTDPEELVRLTADDGLGALPLTSEITPSGDTAFVFTPNSKDVTVLDLQARTVRKRIDVDGKAFVGTWGPNREKLYVPVNSTNTLKVVDPASLTVTASVEVGSKPYGATAGTVRPTSSTAKRVQGALSRLGAEPMSADTTYCLGDCHCGGEASHGPGAPGH